MKYNFTSMNDLNLEGHKTLKGGAARAFTQNKISFAGKTTTGFFPDGSSGEGDRHREYSTKQTGIWQARGESVGEPKADKKYTFRIKKEGQSNQREKTGYSTRDAASLDQNGMQKLALEAVYSGYRDRNGNDMAREKRPFKEMSINDKISKQMTTHKTSQGLRLNTLYNSEKGSKDGGDVREIQQNNFLRTGGFNRGKINVMADGANIISYKENRNYDKPWLKNTVHELASTQTVLIVLCRNGGKQARASPTEFRVSVTINTSI